MRIGHQFTSRLATVTASSLFAASFGGYRCHSIAANEKSSSKPSIAALSPDEFREFKLQSVEKLSRNTKLYRFSLPSLNHETGLVVAR